MTQFLAIRKTAFTLYKRVHQPNDLEISHNLHLHNSYSYPLNNNNVQTNTNMVKASGITKFTDHFKCGIKGVQLYAKKCTNQQT